MKLSHVLVLCVIVLVPACLSPFLIPAAVLALAGLPTQGEVIKKNESILMTGDDRWRHVLEVTYRYRPADSDQPETGTHQVAAPLYRRLKVGSPVKVVYSPFRLQRSMHIIGMGSVLADSTWLSRIPYESDSFRSALEIGAFVITIVLGVIAWRRHSTRWGVAAAFCAAIVFSALLPMGFLVFPILFGVWRARPGQGFGWVLLAAIPLTAAVIYWRIPQPAPAQSGPARTTTATARHVEMVDNLWSNSESSGQHIPQPFQMVDLEFTPEGAAEPVHVLDRVDLNSVAGLRNGATVDVTYPAGNPDSARLDSGTRTYAEKALIYILELTFGLGATLMLVVWPLLLLANRFQHRVKPAIAPDDPRRKALEAYLRSRDRR